MKHGRVGKLRQLLLLTVVAVALIVIYYYRQSPTVSRRTETVNQTESQPLNPEPVLPELTVSDDGSLLRLINSNYPLAADYVPADLVLPDVSLGTINPESQLRLRQAAAAALEEMFATAKQEQDLDLQLASGYRPYATQAAIYESAGGSSQTLVAQPGASEHQSGLAADIKRQDFVCRLEECFANQPEGEWAAANAHRFGYTLRYPEGKEDITGISYEAWHFRYVGVELAEILFEDNLTLEEYHQSTLQ